MRSRTYAPLLVALALVVWLASRTASRSAPGPVAPAGPQVEGAASPPRELAIEEAQAQPLSPPAAPERESIERPSEPSRAIADPIVLHGTVRAHKGGPLDGATLTLEDEAGMRRALVAKYGAFEWRGLPAGAFVLRCSSDGFVAEERLVVLEPSRPGQREDFVLAPEIGIPVRFVAVGEVTEQERLIWPALSLHAVASERAPVDGEPSMPVSSFLRQGRSHGSDPRGELTQGQLLLRRAPPLFVSAKLGAEVLETRALAAIVPELEFVIDPARIRAYLASFSVRIVDGASGAALPKTRAAFFGSITADLPVGEDGVARMEALPPGSYELQAHGPDGLTANLAFELEPREAADLGTLLLRTKVDLEGVLLDPRGDATPGWCRIRRARRDGTDERRVLHVETIGADGRFRVGLPHGSLVVEFGAGDDLEPRHSSFRSYERGSRSSPAPNSTTSEP